MLPLAKSVGLGNEATVLLTTGLTVDAKNGARLSARRSSWSAAPVRTVGSDYRR